VRTVLNAINFRWRCGCTWRMLPHDFPPWETVYMYFRIWRQAGILPFIRDALLHRGSPTLGRKPHADSQ
jgi:putative transposase